MATSSLLSWVLTSSKSAMSATTAMTSTPYVALRRSAVAVSWFSLRAMITRFTLRRAIASAKAAPRPYEPPATRAYGPYV